MPRKIKFDMDDRAWLVANFKDSKGSKCTLAMFGIRMEGSRDKLLLGKNDGKQSIIHLSRTTAKLLIPVLSKFAETGEV